MIQNAEKWRAVVGYDDFYEVSNRGRVRTLYGENHQPSDPRLLRQYPAICLPHSPYKMVRLYGKRPFRDWSVHRLVALAFVPNPGGKPQVNHVDGDKENNCANNLEWVTHAENVRHGIYNAKTPRKPGGIISRISDDDVAIIDEMLRNGVKGVWIAKKFGVQPPTISRIKSRIGRYSKLAPLPIT